MNLKKKSYKRKNTMRKIIRAAVLFIVMYPVYWSCAGTEVVEPLPLPESGDSILVGVEYFSGWWEHSPNKWEYNDIDWRGAYPDRVPLLGEYNSQETMDNEIKAAADHGVDFFSILYYYGGNVETKEIEDVPYLNSGLTYFMNSENSHLMKFMVEVTNHLPFSLLTVEDWDGFMDVCIEAMKHPSYLKIDGRAVLKIHGGDQFYLDMEKSVVQCADILKGLRERTLDAGIGDLLITVGTYGGGSITSTHHFSRIKEIDGTMQYMGVPDLPLISGDYPYDILLAEARNVRDVRQSDVLNWVPYFPSGWNPRPWHDPRAKFKFPTRTQWKNGLEELKSDLIENSNFGFPNRDGTVQKAFTIYAWNEYGEGGMITPTVGEQYMKLEVIKEVFGK